jgi:lipopolysaccharide/colanic/teichoic acid biosynthesis glycosyltransferase
MRRHSLVLLAIDVALIALATILALALRENLELRTEKVEALLPYLCLTLVVALPVLAAFGLNRSIWRLSVLSDYVRVQFVVMTIVVIAVGFAFAYNRLDGVSRSLPLLQIILMTFLLVGARELTRVRHATRRAKVVPLQVVPEEPQKEFILIVGLNRIAELYLQTVTEFVADRVCIAGVLGTNNRHTGRLVQQQKVLGVPEEAARILQDLEVHGINVKRIVVTTAFERLSATARQALIAVEQTSDIKLELFADWTKLDLSKSAEPDRLSNESNANRDVAFTISDADLRNLARRPYWRLKRTVDFLIAVLLLVLTAPVSFVVASLVALDVGWPVVFWQQRPGLGGRPFKLYKFRTMAAAHDLNGRRLSDTDRQTFFGRLIRRSRLDELPQLFNILLGEMSFVGPRPLLPIDQPPAYGARLLVRPGLTGWAQVQGGREVTAADKAALDVWYVRNASPWLDALILLRTVPMAIFGERVSARAIRRAWHELQEAGICLAPGKGTASRHDGLAP